MLQRGNSYLSELSGAPLMLPSKKCNCLWILASDVIRDMKHLLAPRVIQCLGPVEHGPKKRCFGPWRLCGIGEPHVIRPSVAQRRNGNAMRSAGEADSPHSPRLTKPLICSGSCPGVY